MLHKTINIGGLALMLTAGVANGQSANQAPVNIVGTWQCNGPVFGQFVQRSEFSFDPNGNFRMVEAVASAGLSSQPIIGGGQYTFGPTTEGDYNIHLTPVDWQPKQICSGPFGQGGNCTPVALQPADVFFRFITPNTTQTRNGDICERASSIDAAANPNPPTVPNFNPPASSSAPQAPNAQGAGQQFFQMLNGDGTAAGNNEASPQPRSNEDETQ
jgi:hypothetical protein